MLPCLSFLWDMHTIFPDNVYADGNSFRCMGHNGIHTYKDCSVFSNWIHLIEWMPSMEKKGLIVLFFLLWNCPLFLGHRLRWTLECVNEFPVNSSLCVSSSHLCHTHTHTHCMYYLRSPSLAALMKGNYGIVGTAKLLFVGGEPSSLFKGPF